MATATAIGGIALAVVGRPRPPARDAPSGDDLLADADADAVANADADADAVANADADADADADASALDVLIPAHDEADVIGDVISDLGRQEPRTGFRISIVDDRSTDGTGAVARAAIAAAGLSDRASVRRRSGGPDGKAAALAAADRGRSQPATALLVLDADARLDSGFVARCRTAVTRGESAVSARRRVLRPRSGTRWVRFLADAQAAEGAADDVVQRGRTAMGGAGELRGNGMVVRGDVLEDLGGWPVESLTEDLVLSSRLYLRTGRGAARPAGLEIWEQAPVRLRTMFTQRLRWAEGSVRRDLEIVAPALADPTIPLRRRADVAISSAQDLLPWLVLGMLTGSRRRGGPTAAAELQIGYAIAVIAIALRAPEPGVRASRRVAGLLALGASWCAILPLAWLRVIVAPGDVEFRQTPHLSGIDVMPPPFRSSPAGRVPTLPPRPLQVTSGASHP